jgi:hypothetical protein
MLFLFNDGSVLKRFWRHDFAIFPRFFAISRFIENFCTSGDA